MTGTGSSRRTVSGVAWIGDVFVDASVEAKLRERHDLTGELVRSAVCVGHHERAVWHEDPVYGRRLIVTGRTSEDRPIIAYLRPLDETDGLWECLTAWRLDT